MIEFRAEHFSLDFENEKKSHLDMLEKQVINANSQIDILNETLNNYKAQTNSSKTQINSKYDEAKKYKEILADVDAKLEVWLFTSGLSKSALESELRKPIPQEQITPLMWLLLATDDVVSQVGATLKIFCKE